MDSKFVFSLCTFLACFTSDHTHAHVFPVTEFGAVSDGTTDNSMAFSCAWKATCAIPGATVSVPSGTYAVRGASFEGPCNGNTSFQNRGTIRAFPGAHDQDSWISFYNLVGLRIYGRGTFDGNGASTWSTNMNRPLLLNIYRHGISIGSLGRYADEKDVKGIRVSNCNLTNTKNGLRIKTLAPSSVSSRVYNVTFENINVRNVRNPIIIDQYYCPDGSGCSHWKDSEIKIEGVKFLNIKGTSSSPVAIKLQCSKSVPCQNLEFEGVRLTADGGRSKAVICSSCSANYKFVGANQNPQTCGNAPDTYLSR